jgi:hypothetical protein
LDENLDQGGATVTLDGYTISIEGETASIRTAAELVAALDVLQGQHDRLVLQQLRPHLAEILGGPRGFYAVLKVLVPEDQSYLIDALGPRLMSTVQKATALRDILVTLSETKVEDRLIETLGSEGLRTLVNSAEDLAGILEWVYGSSDHIVLQLLGSAFLRRLFQSGDELGLVLNSLDYPRQQELIDILGWEQVLALVRNRYDLARLLRALPGEISRRLLTHWTKEQLWDLVRNDYGWRSLQSFLEAEEVAYLSELLEVNDAE